MRKLLLILIAALVAPIVAQPALAADKIYVMRHLQKAEGTDPPLSAEGAANAQLLAGLLAKSGIKAIFATPTKRAMETGDPLAKALKISITSYDPRNPDELVKAVTGESQLTPPPAPLASGSVGRGLSAPPVRH